MMIMDIDMAESAVGYASVAFEMFPCILRMTMPITTLDITTAAVSVTNQMIFVLRSRRVVSSANNSAEPVRERSHEDH